jgi:hypothetical protein
VEGEGPSVLGETIDLLDMLDRTDRSQGVVAAVGETRAGEIDTAMQLAAQVPDRLPLARIAVLREIAAALARASHHEKAQAAFDQTLQLAYGWKGDPLQRAETLLAIAMAQTAVGMKAAADTTFDQALQDHDAVAGANAHSRLNQMGRNFEMSSLPTARKFTNR